MQFWKLSYCFCGRSLTVTASSAITYDNCQISAKVKFVNTKINLSPTDMTIRKLNKNHYSVQVQIVEIDEEVVEIFFIVHSLRSPLTAATPLWLGRKKSSWVTAVAWHGCKGNIPHALKKLGGCKDHFTNSFDFPKFSQIIIAHYS